jgi:hypothetical protein
MAKKNETKGDKKLTYGQIIKLKECFDEIKQGRIGVTHIPFKTSIVMAGVAIAPHIKVAEEIKESSPKIGEYNEALRGLVMKYCEKDSIGDALLKTDPYPKFGAIVVAGNGYYSYTDESYTEYQKEYKALKEKYQEALDSDKKQEETYKELLKKEVDCEVSFKSLQLDKLPPEVPIHIIEKFIEVGLVTI